MLSELSLLSLQAVLQVLGDGIPDQDILHNALVGQGLASDRGGAVLQQPGLQGSPLIGEPISSYDRILHQTLRTLHKPSQVHKHAAVSQHANIARLAYDMRCFQHR